MSNDAEFMQWRVFGKLFCFVPCDGRGCEYTFHSGELRFGRETVGRGHGFYCEKCWEEHCPGRSWEKADSLLTLTAKLFAEASVDGIVSMIQKRTGND